jgi:DNA-binding transcriptional regulator YdaS (Cro superfamily)
MDPLNRAIEALGGVVPTADAVGVAHSLPSMWRARRRVPPDKCPALEYATEGTVTANELAPDVTWARIPDPTWPHPDGRPCIDVAGPPAQLESSNAK